MKMTNIRAFNYDNALRGMRNPKESWDKSDTYYGFEYYDKNNIALRVVGIIKSKRSTEFNTLINEEAGGFYIKNNLLEEIININSGSDIVSNQIKSNSNLLTGESLSSDDKNLLLNYLGNKQLPYLML